MNSTRETDATLGDLLDRALDKGIMLDADVVISLAGIPLLGLKLRAALAGMETMLKYGIWEDWDQAQRATAAEEQRRKQNDILQPDEQIRLQTIAARWYGNNTYHAWRPGFLYVTNKRVFLLRKDPTEVLFQASLKAIKNICLRRERNEAGVDMECVYFERESGEPVLVRSEDAPALKENIEKAMSCAAL